MVATATRIRRAASTVKAHRANVLRKLGAHNVAHAVAIATARGVFAPDAADIGSITEGQMRAFHAKLGELVRRHRVDKTDEKARLLGLAAARFGREIEGLHDLNTAEASWVLDQLEDAIVALAAA